MMPENETKKELREPRGFGEHTRGLSGEYAHEQGWGLNEGERTKVDAAPQDTDGGTDYEYGARDFGDEPVNTAIPPDAKEPLQNKPRAATSKPIYVRKAS